MDGRVFFQDRVLQRFGEIIVVSQENQPLGTEFEFSVSSGVEVFTQDRVQQLFVEQMKEVAIPVSQMTEHLVVVLERVFHDRFQRWLPSKLST